MSFNPIAGWTVANIRPNLGENPSVVELGNQRLMVDDAILDRIIKKFSDPTSLVNIQALRNLRDLPAQERLPHTDLFYKSLGFKSYTAIDINSKYGSLMMDLNRDLRKDYNFTQTYDLVTNNGTGEHLFNQYQVFNNVHNLTKVGGLMLHIMPFVNWANHGFFSFHPVLFADLSAANAYEMIKFSFANRWAYEVDVDLTVPACKVEKFKKGKSRGLLRWAVRRAKREVKSRTLPFRPPDFLGLHDAVIELNSRTQLSRLGKAIENIKSKAFPNVMVVAVMRKSEDKPFQIPMQGKYVQDAEASEIKERYKGQEA